MLDYYDLCDTVPENISTDYVVEDSDGTPIKIQKHQRRCSPNHATAGVLYTNV